MPLRFAAISLRQTACELRKGVKLPGRSTDSAIKRSRLQSQQQETKEQDRKKAGWLAPPLFKFRQPLSASGQLFDSNDNLQYSENDVQRHKDIFQICHFGLSVRESATRRLCLWVSLPTYIWLTDTSSTLLGGGRPDSTTCCCSGKLNAPKLDPLNQRLP